MARKYILTDDDKITPSSTYDPSSEDAVNGKAINAAIGELDVTDTAENGKYVSSVSEVDGKIIVTRQNLPSNSSGYTAGEGINISDDNEISTETRIIDKTQAEYDALSEEEKNDPSVFYSITDVEYSSVSSPFRFGITDDGQYGYYKVGADTVTPFKINNGLDENIIYDKNRVFNYTLTPTIYSDSSASGSVYYKYKDTGLYAYIDNSKGNKSYIQLETPTYIDLSKYTKINIEMSIIGSQVISYSWFRVDAKFIENENTTTLTFFRKFDSSQGASSDGNYYSSPFSIDNKTYTQELPSEISSAKIMLYIESVNSSIFSTNINKIWFE